jgi:hypothetical protein
MKTRTGFASLCALLITLGYAATNLDAMTYGKMSGGMSYTIASNAKDNHEALIKVQQAKDLAAKINDIEPSTFNNLPIGLTKDEFIYELLNYPEDVLDDTQNAKIYDSLRNRVLALDSHAPRTRANLITIRDITDRCAIGVKVLSDTKIVDQRLNKKIATDIFNKFTELDTKVAKALNEMREKIVAVGNKAAIEKKVYGDITKEEKVNDEITKFKAKIKVIEEYIPKFKEIYDGSDINFANIYEGKQKEVLTSTQKHYMSGVGRNIPSALIKISEQDPLGKAAANSIVQRRVMLEAILNQMRSFAEQLTMLDGFHKINDEKLIEVWQELGSIARSLASHVGHGYTPQYIFHMTGLFELATLRDIDFQRKLFQSLPENVKQPTGAPGVTTHELDTRYLIPSPEDRAWEKFK